jgi:hypothetical protein
MNKQKKNYSRIRLNQHNSIHKCTELELFLGDNLLFTILQPTSLL